MNNPKVKLREKIIYSSKKNKTSQDKPSSPSFPKPGPLVLCDVQGGLRPVPGRTGTLRFQGGRQPRIFELNHMVTVLQVFLPQYWNWTHWPNKVQIKNKKGGSAVKDPPANAGDTSLTPVPGRSHMPWSS